MGVDINCWTSKPSTAAPFRATKYRNIPLLDLTAPTEYQLRAAVAFITREVARGTVYIHCKIGFSRSAAVAGAYLLASRNATTVDEAVARLRKVRPAIVIRPEAMEAIRGFERREKENADLYSLNHIAEQLA